MNIVMYLGLIVVLALSGSYAQSSYAWVVLPDEKINEAPSPELWNPGTGEYINTINIIQRIDQRLISTEQGMVEVPAGVVIIDSRPVDEWFLEQKATAKFVFAGDKMIRVEIKK